LKLVIVHCHYRPGGVRRIIELAAPHLVAALRPAVAEVVLVGGETADSTWGGHFAAQLGQVPITWATDPALGYYSELPSAIRARRSLPLLERRIREHLERVLQDATPANCVVWAHNQGLGRNLLVTRWLGRLCAARGVPLVFHHHDWWFDNRWARWAEMRHAGFRTLADVARTIFPTDATIRHAAINQADASLLRRHFGPLAGWLPNLSQPAALPPRRRVTAARRWLDARLGSRAPVWLVPCRLLRRKNLAEALLLTRWLRPEAWLVTTGGTSSADESAYSAALAEAARRRGWRLQLGVLAEGETAAPSVADLMETSEVVLLTSLQEGFGLPNLEAAAAGRPLITRRLPNIAPDLARFGFRFPQLYDDVRIDQRLFDGPAEIQRQARSWAQWRATLPHACRPPTTAAPRLPAAAESAGVPFSRLTLPAQLEVLAHDPQESWAACALLNPFLTRWRERATDGALQISKWPPRAAQWLSGPSYARRWVALLGTRPDSNRRPGRGENPSIMAAEEFIRSKLARENQYPLLWTSEP
jgi:glycosyltransferase involved in cell wall biosynthesis